jgi:hypothetical protein
MGRAISPICGSSTPSPRGDTGTVCRQITSISRAVFAAKGGDPSRKPDKASIRSCRSSAPSPSSTAARHSLRQSLAEMTRSRSQTLRPRNPECLILHAAANLNSSSRPRVYTVRKAAVPATVRILAALRPGNRQEMGVSALAAEHNRASLRALRGLRGETNRCHGFTTETGSARRDTRLVDADPPGHETLVRPRSAALLRFSLIECLSGGALR